MSRTKGIPTYRLHKQSGQAVVTLTDPTGRRKDVLLGEHNTPESKAEYARVLAAWQGQGRQLPGQTWQEADLTMNELILAFLRHAEQYYRHPDGTSTVTLKNFKLSLRPLRFLYGPTLAREFGPLALKAVRELMVNGYDHPDHGPQESLCRNNVNQRIGRIKHVFKWAVANQLVPSDVFHGLQAIEGLRRGRSAARETEPVKPVPTAFVEATIGAAVPTVGDMICLQMLTAIRPGELVIMRGIDLDMTGPIWQYTPKTHKTQHYGHSRVIEIGPQAQAIIRRHLKADVQAPLFSPREAAEERYRVMRARRKSKVQPSQVCRKKATPKKLPGEQYDTMSYGKAVKAAAKKASVPHWHPHQLRHTRATEIRKRFGIDAARAVLGHRSPAITEVYAELDQGQAAEVMAKIG